VRQTVPVDVVLGPIPVGADVGETSVTPKEVTVFGPSTIVSKVDHVRADVVIQPSGIDVDQDIILIAVDSLGNAVSPVEVQPRTAHVQIPVFTDRKSKTLPVSPVITGTPAAGFEVSGVTVTPLSATVEGDADQLAKIDKLDTLPVSVTGASSDFSSDIGLDLPTGIVPLSDATVRVSVTLRPVTGTRTIDAGLRLLHTRTDLTYEVSVDRVLVTIGGSIADLDRLQGSFLAMDLDVGDLVPGSSEVQVTASLATGLTLVSVSPATVTVTVTGPPSPSPSASPSPGG